MGCVQVTATRVGNGVRVTSYFKEREVTATRVGGFLNPTAKLTCVFSIPYYVKVAPEIIWLTEANSFRMDVDVISNTDWTIE